MSQLLTQALKKIELYKATSPHYNELLDILGEVLLLRQEQKQAIDKILFPVEERFISAKMKGGFPLLDFTQMDYDITRPRQYFLKLLTLAEQKGYDTAVDLAADIIEGRLDFRQLLSGALTEETAEEDDIDSLDGEGDISFEMMDFLLDECLRPELELVAEKYADLINAAGWSEGYCPVCGEEPKIGEIQGAEETRLLFCYRCGFKWSFDPIKCPFCGNQEYHSLAYFTIEGDARYRVDVCNSCNRYIKMVDSRDSAEQVNLDVEDLATLYLDLLAYEEGYN